MESKVKLTERKENVIPKGFFKLYTKYSQDFMILIRENCSLPLFFYNFILILTLVQGSASFLLVFKAEIWDPNNNATQIIRYLSFIWRFASTSTDQTDLTITFAVLIALFVAGNLLQVVLLVVFWKTNHLDKVLCWISCFTTEFVLALVNISVPPEMGALLGKIVTDKYLSSVEINTNDGGSYSTYGDRSARIVMLIIYFFIYIIHIFLNVSVGTTAFFEQGRCQLWSIVFGHIHFTFAISLLAFLTRLCEFLDGVYFYVFFSLSAIMLALLMINEIIYLPFISTHIQAIHLAFSCSSFVLFVIQIVSFSGVVISNVSFLLVFFGVGFILSVVFYSLIIKYENFVLNRIDLYGESKIGFAQCFKNQSAFIKMIRIGFKYGNQVVLAWHPFQEGLDRYGDSETIWMIYLRFLSVYYEENSKLSLAIDQYKLKKFNSLQSISFLTQMKLVEKSRSRNFSKDIRKSFKQINTMVSKARILVITYWNAVADNSLSTAYDVGHLLKRSFENCQSAYFHLITFYPNNPVICHKYARFLERVIRDPQEAIVWHQRAEFLEKSPSFIIDMSQTQAQKLFPMLPLTINAALKSDGEDESESMSVGESTSTASTSSLGSATFDPSSNVNFDSTQSLYRQYGFSVPIGVISSLTLFVVLFFIISFLGGQFVIPIIIQNGSFAFKDFFSGVISLCNLNKEAQVASFCMMRRSLKNMGYELEFNKLAQGIDIKKQLINESKMLEDAILSINSEVQQITEKFASDSKHYSLAGIKSYSLFVPSQIPFYLSGSKTIRVHNTTFLEAMNGFTFMVHQYDQNDTSSFLNESWMASVLLNTDFITKSLNWSATKICIEMNDSLTKSYKLSMNLSLFFICLTIVMVPIFIYHVMILKENWKFTISAINSLPVIAIQKVINSFSNTRGDTDNDNYNKEESKYANQFIQMQSACDTYGGLPISTLIAISVLSAILAIASIIISNVIIWMKVPELNSLPNRFLIVTQYISSVFSCGNLVYRLILDQDNDTFWLDTKEKLHRNLDESYGYFNKASKDFVMSEWEGYPSNILGATPEIADYLLEGSHEMSLENLTSYDFFNEMAPIIQIETIQMMMDILYTFVDDEYEMYSRTVTFLNHEMLYHIYPNYLLYITKACQSFLVRRINVIVQQTYYIASGLLLLGIFMTIFQLYKLNSVKKTIRFVISTLSMVEPTYIENATTIMNLFGGVFEGSLVSDTENAIKVKCQDVVPEAAIVADLENRVLYANDSAKVKCGYVMGSTLKSEISSNLISFTSGHPFNISETMKVFPYRSPQGNEITLLFREETRNDKKMLKVQKLVDSIHQLKSEIIPNKLHKKMDFSSNQYMFHSNSLILAAIEIMHFKNIIEHDVKDSVSTFSLFHAKIKEIANESHDAAVVQSIGLTFFVCFNMEKQTSNVYEIGEDTIDFIKKVFAFTNNQGIKIRAGLVFNKMVLSGIRKNDIKFNVYSKAIHKAHLLCVRSCDDKILVTQKTFGMLPNSVLNIAKEEQIVLLKFSPEKVICIDMKQM